MLIVDLANPLDPKIIATLPLKNSVVGPPVNLAIDPTGSLALVADSVNVIMDGGSLKQVPDDKIHVIDLKSNAVKLVQTMTTVKQPSGLSISPAGDLALDQAMLDYREARFPPQSPGHGQRRPQKITLAMRT